MRSGVPEETVFGVVRERRVIVEETQEHGFAVFFGEHEVEGVEGAPEREGDAFAGVYRCQFLLLHS